MSFRENCKVINLEGKMINKINISKITQDKKTTMRVVKKVKRMKMKVMLKRITHSNIWMMVQNTTIIIIDSSILITKKLLSIMNNSCIPIIKNCTNLLIIDMHQNSKTSYKKNWERMTMRLILITNISITFNSKTMIITLCIINSTMKEMNIMITKMRVKMKMRKNKMLTK